MGHESTEDSLQRHREEEWFWAWLNSRFSRLLLLTRIILDFIFLETLVHLLCFEAARLGRARPPTGVTGSVVRLLRPPKVAHYTSSADHRKQENRNCCFTPISSTISYGLVTLHLCLPGQSSRPALMWISKQKSDFRTQSESDKVIAGINIKLNAM